MRDTASQPNRSIHIGADVGSSPIWEHGLNQDTSSYPLSSTLAKALDEWATEYASLLNRWDAYLDERDPRVIDHDKRGEQLWKRVVGELGADFQVHYDSPIRGESALIHPLPSLEHRPDLSERFDDGEA